MIIGPSDSGKTMLANYLLFKLCAIRSTVGFIDCDIGQSSLGPPGTIGAAIFSRFNPDKTIEQQADNTRLFFVGSYAPMGHVVEMLMGLKIMVDYLTQLNCDLIIIDTTGLVENRLGFYLKKSKIELTQPSHIIIFQQQEELQTLIAFCKNLPASEIHLLPISEKIQKRSLMQRRDYRMNKLQEYFRNSTGHTIPFAPVMQWSKDIFTTIPHNDQNLSQLSTFLGQEPPFAALLHNVLIFVSETWIDELILIKIKELFQVETIHLLSSQRVQLKLISIEDTLNNILSLGIIQEIDFKQRMLKIIAPAFDLTKINHIKIGMASLDFLPIH